MSQTNSKSRGGVVSALCRIIGIIFIVAVILTAVPLTVPRIMGYEIYNVESGSMEPTIPVGSVIYVKPIRPVDIRADDIITFQTDGGEVTHRVLINRIVEQEFVTKGDANDAEDLAPIPYQGLIGIVERHYPVIGKFLVVYSSTLGKVYILAFAACGVLLNVLGSMLKSRKRD